MGPPLTGGNGFIQSFDAGVHARANRSCDNAGVENTLTLGDMLCSSLSMVSSYRHFKDTKRARLLRETVSRMRSSPEGADVLPPMEQLCEGGGNIFAELGFPHPEQELLKALLTIQICRIIKERKVTQVQAADMLGITQQQISALKNNRLSSFSVGRLIELLVALGQDVEIAIRPARKDRGQVSLSRSSAFRYSLFPKLRALFVRSRDTPDT